MSDLDRWILQQLRDPYLWIWAILMVLIGYAILVILLGGAPA